MTAAVVKIVDRAQPALVTQAEDELRGAGFVIMNKIEADFTGVDAVQCGGDEDNYGPAVILIAKK